MRLIDADDLLADCVFSSPQFERGMRAFIGDAPTIDAVQVVRCKDCNKRDICRTSNIWAIPPTDDWFCADGERRDDD